MSFENFLDAGLPGRPSSVVNLYAELANKIRLSIEKVDRAEYIPTGLQEDMIRAAGIGSWRIVYISSANKVGKTTAGVNILKNIIFERDPLYFDYGNFNEWPYPRQGRIIGTVKNTADDGPIRQEILRWFNADKYTSNKAGKNYHSQYDCRNGFLFDVMTYQQEPSEFEGPLLGWTWCDEPPPAKLLGAILSRFSKGGLLIITATPIKAGPFLDVLDDLEDKGTKVKRIETDIYGNSIENGKINSRGTKRGLMTDAEITEYVNSIPLEERDARIFGKASNKSGKIFPMFDRSVHVRDYDIASPYAKKWNCYTVMDPHPKRFPAILWCAKTHDEKHVIYNEWPTHEDLKGYYDEVGHARVCPYTPEIISSFIHALDGSQFGLKIMGRTIDPRMAKNTEGQWGKSNESLLTLYTPYGINFELPPMEGIEKQREHIRALLSDYIATNPVNQYNEPSLFVLPHCVNTIRALERHYWNEDSEKENETYKDFIDCIRYYLAYTENLSYVDTEKKVYSEEPVLDVMAVRAAEFFNR